ncbi:MAG: hypothetical protein HQL44_17155 [Alphaproteobacteria bacterium]|nr:hypothetical protein [Alphaproteobacteria bacterium]
MTATFSQPDYTTNSNSTAYPLSIDASIAVLARVAAQFAAHEQSTPNMTVRVDAGVIPAFAATPAEVAAQSTGTITAPSVNPRNDIVYIDPSSGAVGVATGAESATPSDPAVPAGKIAIARISLTVGMTEIANVDIDDLRQLGLLGLGGAATKNTGTTAGTVAAGDHAHGGVYQPADTLLDDIAGLTLAQGDVLYFDGTNIVNLGPGTSGQFLKTQGASANPIWDDVGGGGPALATAVATTSGSSHDVTGIAAGTQCIEIMFNGVGRSSTVDISVQIGDSGGIETSGYEGGGFGLIDATLSRLDFSSYFTAVYSGSAAAGAYRGAITLRRESATSNTWTYECKMNRNGGGALTVAAGSKALTGELDRFRVSVPSGSFNAGEFNYTIQAGG